mgnify:CR=1 FL=1
MLTPGIRKSASSKRRLLAILTAEPGQEDEAGNEEEHEPA